MRLGSMVWLMRIRFYEESTEEYIFDGSNACLTGMGIGLLASAAIAMSQSMSDIPLAGAEAVRTAFRLGVLVDEVSQNLEPREEGSSPDTWAIVVTGVNESGVQKELDTIQSKIVSRLVQQTLSSKADGSSRPFLNPARSSLVR